MSIVCPSCGAALPDGTRFCPKDGTTFSKEASGPHQALLPTAALTPAAKEKQDPLIGRLIDARYRVRKKLGSGGVGAVYEGEHVEIKKTVAIKVLHGIFASTEEFRRRFEREARAASRIEHPGCVAVLDFGRVSTIDPEDPSLVGMPYLVMEFVRGELLADRLDAVDRMPPAEAVRVAVGLCAALRHAHGLGIVHRDLKPANIMLLKDDEGGLRTKLLDFGLAKDLAGDGKEETLTQTGMVFGTPSYLSPEQASGAAVDHRADLYALGVVLFEMICGRRPFVNQDPLDTVRDHIGKPPPSPKSLDAPISNELDAVMLRALAKKPDERFANAEALASALQDTPEGRGVVATGPAAPGKIAAVPASRPAWLPLAVGGGALVVAIVVVAVVLSSGSPTPALTAQPLNSFAPQQTSSPEALKRRIMAADYQAKLWCTDAIEELEKALRADPAMRKDPEVIRIAIACLTPKTRGKSIRFLAERVGPDALAPLRAALAGDPNPEVRQGAEKALERIQGGP